MKSPIQGVPLTETFYSHSEQQPGSERLPEDISDHSALLLKASGCIPLAVESCMDTPPPSDDEPSRCDKAAILDNQQEPDLDKQEQYALVELIQKGQSLKAELDITKDLPELTAKLAAIHAGEVALDTLVRIHRPYLYGLARRYRGTSLTVDDLFGYGMVGFMKAIHKFDVSLGHSVSTYVVRTAQGEILRAIRDLDRPISIRAQMDHGKAISSAQQDLRQKLGREPTDSEIAETTGIKMAVIKKIQDLKNTSSFENLLENQLPTSSQHGRHSMDPADIVTDRHMVERATKIIRTDPAFSDRDRTILAGRLLVDPPRAQADIGSQLGISQMQVSRLEARAIRTLRRLMSTLSS